MDDRKGRSLKTKNRENCPFGLAWLDSCYQQTLLPNGPWNEKIHPILCDNVAQKMERQLDYPERKQMIFELLGQDFVKKYFPNDNYRPELLEPPIMTAETRLKLQCDARNWLQGVINRAASETGCQRLVTADATGGEISEEMQEFMQHTRMIFKNGLDRELYLLEDKAINSNTEADWRLKKEVARGTALKALNREEGRSNKRKSILKRNQSVPVDVDLMTSRSTGRDEEEGGDKVTAAAWMIPGTQSNFLGESVKVILRRDPRRFAQVVRALHGRPLPSTLRSYIWMDVMLKHERDKINDVNLEKIVRERFGRSVARGMSDLKITRPGHSPISGLIDNGVIEIHDKTPAMRDYIDDDVHGKEATKALNVLYVYDRSFEPYLVYWLFPLQITFSEDKGKSEHTIELAMYLDLFNKGCFPKWPEIYAIAEHTLSRLAAVDPDFCSHLKSISQINPTINPKEFLVYLIHQEKSKARELLAASQSVSVDSSQMMLADPVILVRKWVGEAFVSVLDIQTLMYVWDQCFMQRWKSVVLEDFCLVILLLLRSRFMAARDYSAMKRVFLDDPCKLYTHDVQRAWIHVQNGKDLNLVPPMNRMISSPESRVPTPLEFDLSRISSAQQSRTTSPDESRISIADTFDLYIDGLSNIPDSGTIVKITGRVIRTGTVTDVADVLAFPDPTSVARSPVFTYKQVVNERNARMDSTATLLLRVYTVVEDTGELVIIGNTAFDLYDKSKKGLRVGNYMQALHHGMPDMNNTGSLTGDSFEGAPKIPACRLFFRLLEHDKNYMSAPPLTSEHYQQLDTPLTYSDQKIVDSFLTDKQFPPTVTDMTRYLQIKEDAKDRDKPLMDWYKARLDPHIHIQPGQVPSHLSLSHIVRYRQDVGLAVQIERAFGLPEGMYIQCSAVLLNAGMSSPDDVTGATSGRFMTSKLNTESLQTAPQWTDEATIVYPRAFNNSCLLVTVHGVDVVYKPDPAHVSSGEVMQRSGLPLNRLGRDTRIGWAVVPLFNNGYALTGEHHVPIFKGEPTSTFLRSLGVNPVHTALQSTHWTNDTKYQSASLVVNVWDGHFLSGEYPEDLPKHEMLLDAVGNKEAYLRAERDFTSKHVYQFVYDSLTKKERNLGMSSPIYKKELRLFEEAMSQVFYKLEASA